MDSGFLGNEKMRHAVSLSGIANTFADVEYDARLVISRRDHFCRKGWFIYQDITVISTDGRSYEVLCILDDLNGLTPIYMEQEVCLASPYYPQEEL